MHANKRPLLGMTLDELKTLVKSLGMPAFTGGQIAQWIYQKHVQTIEEMTNISKKNRDLLSAEYEVGTMPHIDAQHSKDGTIKYLFPTENGKSVETVFIPDHDRATLCVSCQVGCKMNCLFCQTGKQGFEGSLTTRDILNQIYALPEIDRLTNIVYMGQGEPMDNLDNVLRSTQLLQADYGFAWSPKRITVSSVGIKGKLQRFLEESDCHLAISLHTPIPEQRAQLMPAEKGMPIKDVVELLKKYFPSRELRDEQGDTRESAQRRLTFEYTIFGGTNDSQMHARELLKLLRPLDCRVNLIRWHKIPGVELSEADDSKMESMRDYLNNHGITTTIRASRGQDIYAACGLLNTKYKDGK